MNYNIFASRTTWTVIAMFVIGGVQAIHPLLPSSVTAALDGVLGMVAIYFHVNPSQQYNPPA